MRYVIALVVMLMWGGMQFASAQDNKNCSPASSEGTTNSDMSDDASVQGNEDVNVSGDANVSEDDNLKINTESDSQLEEDTSASVKGESEYEIQNESDQGVQPSDQSEMENESDQSVQPTGEGDQCPNGSTSMSTSSTETTTITTEEKEHSTFGKILRSPFKLIGNIPKAGVSLVSETLEGTGHIVGAPFKAVGKLFGRNEDDSDNDRKKIKSVEQHVDVVREVDEEVQDIDENM